MEIKLREISRSDLKEMNKWRNDTQVSDRLGAPFRYINEEVDERWFENYMAHRDTCVRLTITAKNDGAFRGNINLTGIDWINRSAEYSICIPSTEFRGLGIGKRASQEVLNHAFFNMNLNRVYLFVLETNTEARSLYEKLGFKTEGILRQAVFKNGNYVNLIQMSLLREDFQLS